MKDFRRVFCSAILLVVASANAAMGQEVPEGWHLQEEDMSGVIDLTLAWYEPGSGDVKIALHCQQGFSDVVLTIYVDGPGSGPVGAVLERDGTRFAFESDIGAVNGFTVEAITTFGPELVALLKGGFSVSVDGAALGDFEPKSGKGEIDRIVEACPAG